MEETVLLMFRIISMVRISRVYPADAFLRSRIFRIVLYSASSFFTALRSTCSWIFLNFQKNTQEKQLDEVWVC